MALGSSNSKWVSVGTCGALWLMWTAASAPLCYAFSPYDTSGARPTHYPLFFRDSRVGPKITTLSTLTTIEIGTTNPFDMAIPALTGAQPLVSDQEARSTVDRYPSTTATRAKAKKAATTSASTDWERNLDESLTELEQLSSGGVPPPPQTTTRVARKLRISVVSFEDQYHAVPTSDFASGHRPTHSNSYCTGSTTLEPGVRVGGYTNPQTAKPSPFSQEVQQRRQQTRHQQSPTTESSSTSTAPPPHQTSNGSKRPSSSRRVADPASTRRSSSRAATAATQTADPPSSYAEDRTPAAPLVRGVFCGYRITPEEYRRLKSAHVLNDYSVFDHSRQAQYHHHSA
jgi:hypothetical protein